MKKVIILILILLALMLTSEPEPREQMEDWQYEMTDLGYSKIDTTWRTSGINN